jgi:hypothetical protein
VLPAGDRSSRALAGAYHRVLALCVQCLEVSVSDVRVEVSWQGEPGPRPDPEGPLAGRDAVRLRVRQLLLAPKGACLTRSGSHGKRGCVGMRCSPLDAVGSPGCA